MLFIYIYYTRTTYILAPKCKNLFNNNFNIHYIVLYIGNIYIASVHLIIRNLIIIINNINNNIYFTTIFFFL